MASETKDNSDQDIVAGQKRKCCKSEWKINVKRIPDVRA